MPRKLTTTKEAEMQKTLVNIPEDLYRQLRHHCIEANLTQSEAITEALKRYLGTKGGEKAKK